MQEPGSPANTEVLVEAFIDSLLDASARPLRAGLSTNLEAVARMPDTRQARPKPKRRLGWAAAAVMQVLARASQPMTAGEIVDAIWVQFAEEVTDSTVRHTLRRGKEARSGAIVQVGVGLYQLAERGRD